MSVSPSVAVLEEFLQSDDPILRATGAGAIARAEREELVEVLITRLVDDDDPEVRRTVVTTLLDASPELRVPAANALVAVLARAPIDRCRNAYPMLAELARLGTPVHAEQLPRWRRTQLAAAAFPRLRPADIAARARGFAPGMLGAVAGLAIASLVALAIGGVEFRSLFPGAIAAVLVLPAFAFIATSRSRPYAQYAFRESGRLVETLRTVPEQAVFVFVVASIAAIAGVPNEFVGLILLKFGAVCIGAAIAVRAATVAMWDDDASHETNRVWQIAGGTGVGVLAVAVLAALPPFLGRRTDPAVIQETVELLPFSWAIAITLAVAFARIDAGVGSPGGPLHQGRARRPSRRRRWLATGSLAVTVLLLLVAVANTRRQETIQLGTLSGMRIFRVQRLPTRVHISIPKAATVSWWSIFAWDRLVPFEVDFTGPDGHDDFQMSNPGDHVVQYRDSLDTDADRAAAKLAWRVITGLLPIDRLGDLRIPTLLPRPPFISGFASSADTATLYSAILDSLVNAAAPKSSSDSITLALHMMARKNNDSVLIRSRAHRYAMIVIMRDERESQLAAGRPIIDWRWRSWHAAIRDTIAGSAQQLCDASVRLLGARARADRAILAARHGQFDAARQDLQAFLDSIPSVNDGTIYSKIEVARGPGWLAQLAHGLNPFSDALLRELRAAK